MNNEQILKKAIEKAVKNGWNMQDITMFEEHDSHYSDVWFFYHGFDYLALEIIFSHDFAKAFWGENWVSDENPHMIGYNLKLHDWPMKPSDNIAKTPAEEAINFDNKRNRTAIKIKSLLTGLDSPWQYHLQQMVLEKEPIKYLEKFL